MPAETALVQSVCDTMHLSIDQTLKTLFGAQAVASPLLNSLKSALQNTSFSPPAALQNGLAQVGALVGQVPNLSSVKGLGDFCQIISSCTFFNLDPVLKNPISLLQRVQSAMNTNFYSKILGIGNDFGLPELGLANNISQLTSFLNKYRLDNLLPKTNLAFTCIQKICNRDIGDTLRQYNLLQGVLNLTTGGTLDLATIYNFCNLSSIAISNLTLSIASVGSVTDEITKQFAVGINAIRRNANWCLGF